jgi:hypothetical protein
MLYSLLHIFLMAHKSTNIDGFTLYKWKHVNVMETPVCTITSIFDL